MSLKIRFLLTNACSASCPYCHNEGQRKAKNTLSLSSIQHVLETLANEGECIEEIILSGGEPTQHPDLSVIAALCHATGALVSMNTHGAHHAKVAAALPWLDELKIHVDSFDPQRQKQSMGISIAKVLRSIKVARHQPGLRTVVNHPLRSIDEACEVISETRRLGVECKLIELYDASGDHPGVQDLPWMALGYRNIAPGAWQHIRSEHKVLSRRCGIQDERSIELFIGADGVRHSLEGIVVGYADHFTIEMMPGRRTAQSRLRLGKLVMAHPA